MSKRHNDQFIAALDDNEVVRKTAKNNAFCALTAGASRHRRKGKEAVLYNIHGRFNRVGKLSAEVLPLHTNQAPLRLRPRPAGEFVLCELPALYVSAHSLSKFDPVHQFRLSGIKFADSPRNFMVPGFFSPIVSGRVETLDQVMGQFRLFGLRKRQNLGT